AATSRGLWWAWSLARCDAVLPRRERAHPELHHPDLHHAGPVRAPGRLMQASLRRRHARVDDRHLDRLRLQLHRADGRGYLDAGPRNGHLSAVGAARDTSMLRADALT